MSVSYERDILFSPRGPPPEREEEHQYGKRDHDDRLRRKERYEGCRERRPRGGDGEGRCRESVGNRRSFHGYQMVMTISTTRRKINSDEREHMMT